MVIRFIETAVQKKISGLSSQRLILSHLLWESGMPGGVLRFQGEKFKIPSIKIAPFPKYSSVGDHSLMV